MSATDVVIELFEVLHSGPDWTDARCRDKSGATTRLFFSDQISEIARAKSICAGCPYQAACLDGALQRNEACGVWGGQLIANGQIIAHKKARGRPPKNPNPEVRLSA